MQASNLITLETKTFAWQIDETGCTRSFTAVGSGQNIVDTTAAPAAFCRLVQGECEIMPAGVAFRGGQLIVDFPGAGPVRLDVEIREQYLVLRVASAPDGCDRLVFLDVPLRPGAAAADEFVACAVSLNLQTRVDGLPGPQSRLAAQCYRRFGLTGAAAVAAAPFHQLRGILKTVVNGAPDLPKSPRGGPWAMDARENFTSYLFGVATEDTVDEWIELCRDFGMDQLHFCGQQGFRYGDYLPEPKSFPNGMAGARKVVDRLHQAGIMAGLHTMSFSIRQNTPYVAPVPDKRLAREASYTLAAPLSAADDTVLLAENTGGLPGEISYHIRRSMTLRIDDELIEFTRVNARPPFGVGGCRRGAWGTRAAPHARGAVAHHLKACWGMFAPDGESTLFNEIAGNIARTVNECGFDMIYLDGLDGIHILGGEEARWHYGGRFAFEVFKRLNRPVIMEMAAFLHHLWFLRSRMGAWDHPIRGYTPFLDHHVRSNAQCARIFLPAHLGWWAPRTARGLDMTTTDIENMAGLACKNETTHVEDVEYLCAQALDSGAGFSLQGLSPQAVRQTPHLKRLAPVFKRYSVARQESGTDVAPDGRNQTGTGLPSDRSDRGEGAPAPTLHTKADMSDRGEGAPAPTLYTKADMSDRGEGAPAPTLYTKADMSDRGEGAPAPKLHTKAYMPAVTVLRHTVTGLDDGSDSWRVQADTAQPAKIRVEALWSVAPFDDGRGMVVADFADPAEFRPGWEVIRILNSGKKYSYPGAAPGMKIWLESAPDAAPAGDARASARLRAERKGAGGFPVSSVSDRLSLLDHGERIYEDRPASWAWLGKKFSPELDLIKCPAIGLWVHGDGSGAVLNVQLAGLDRTQALEDHYVPLDFTGWRYVELVEPEAERFENYAWPYGRCVYDIYRATIQYAQVAGINLWLNHVPANGGAACLLSRIRALPLIRTKINQPVLTINGCKFALPFDLTAGDWVEIGADGMATAFAPDGREIRSAPMPGGPIRLEAGSNDLAFQAQATSGRCRARVTVAGQP